MFRLNGFWQWSANGTPPVATLRGFLLLLGVGA